MDPNVSTTPLNLFSGVPGAESLPQKFPLLFSNAQNPVSKHQADHEAEESRSCTTKEGTQVNVITGGSSGAVGQLNVKNSGVVVSRASSGVDTFNILVKVVNPINKQTYMPAVRENDFLKVSACRYTGAVGGKVLLA